MRLERIDDLAIIRINTGKANSINPDWIAGMNRALDELGDARAVVITGHETFFSAGLDLPTLLGLDQPGMLKFIQSFSDVMLRIFSVRQPIVSAINGHAVAGGCVLALQTDYRIMTEGKGKIGLNEVVLGIGLPTLVIETLRAQVPASSIVPVALEGQLFAPNDAKAIGLVQEVVAPNEVFERALAKARQWAALPSVALQQIKQSIRRPIIEAIKAAKDHDAALWTGTWFSPAGQKILMETVMRLKGGRS